MSDIDPTQPENVNPILNISIGSILEKIKDLKVGFVFELDRLPIKDEITSLCTNPFEVLFITTKDGRIYFSKGDEGDTGFEKVREKLKDAEIDLVAHTHPYRENGNINRVILDQNLPSDGDLTSQLAAPKQYLMGLHGRTTFFPIRNLYSRPNSNVSSRGMINTALRLSAQEAHQKGLTQMPEILNHMGEYVGSLLGPTFKYQSWDEISDPWKE